MVTTVERLEAGLIKAEINAAKVLKDLGEGVRVTEITGIGMETAALKELSKRGIMSFNVPKFVEVLDFDSNADYYKTTNHIIIFYHLEQCSATQLEGLNDLIKRIVKCNPSVHIVKLIIE